MNEVAKPIDGRETVYVCGACGKRSKDRFGYQAIDRGWDESCMLKSFLAFEDKLVISNGRVSQVLDGGLVG